MTHGDDRGLRIPPKMAPLEAVFVPIVRSQDDRAVAACREAAEELRAAGFRVRVDERDQQPGWKYSEWDLRGVPVRVEIGPRDVDAGTVVLVRRDRDKGDPQQRSTVAREALARTLPQMLDDDAGLALRRRADVPSQPHAAKRATGTSFYRCAANAPG